MYNHPSQMLNLDIEPDWKKVDCQSHYNASLDMVGVNFENSGRSTDTTSPNQTYDLMIPGKFRNKFGVVTG